MNSKKWIFMFLGALLLALALCAAANVLTDPFGVFGDPVFRWYSYDDTNNPRTAKLAYLEKHHGEYDSYIIGSSSAASYDTAELNERMGARFYNLFVYGCDMKDNVDYARYVVNHYEVKNIVLNVGINEAYTYDFGNDSLTGCEHALASGESLLGFYAKYAFCNPKFTLEKLQSYRQDQELPKEFDVFDAATGCYDKRVRDIEKIGDIDVYNANHQEAFYPETGGELPYISQCAESVAEIKALCAQRGVNLIVVFSPVYIAQWNECTEETIREYKQSLAEVSDYWDFSYSSLSYDPRYFYDVSHFRNAVCAMMLTRMYGGGGYCPEDFGEYVTADNVESCLDRGFSEVVAAPAESYSVSVPALMYHSVAASGGKNDDTVTTPENFRRELELIKSAGYTPVSAEEVVNYVYYGSPLPDKPVMITLDDGYLDNYETAYPLLKKYGIKATIFAIGSSFGHSDYKDTGKPMIPHFSYEQAAEMMSSGLVDVQCHSYDMHQWGPYETSGAPVRESMQKLPGETDAEYMQAIAGDFEKFRSEYETNTGRKVFALSYPEGRYTDLAEITLHSLGVTLTMSTETNCKNTLVKGLPQTLYRLCRFNVPNSVSDGELLGWLAAG